MSTPVEELAEMLSNMAASLETMLAHYGRDLVVADMSARSGLVSAAKAMVQKYAPRFPFTVAILDENLQWLGPVEVEACNSDHAVLVAGQRCGYDTSVKTYHSVVVYGNHHDKMEVD
jgi:hypothetical protein